MGSSTSVRLHCRRWVQAISIASGIELKPDVRSRFVRDRVLDEVVATEAPDGTAIPPGEQSVFFGTPKGFEQPMLQFIDNSELDGPSLFAAVECVFKEIHRRLEDDRRLRAAYRKVPCADPNINVVSLMDPETGKLMFFLVPG